MGRPSWRHAHTRRVWRSDGPAALGTRGVVRDAVIQRNMSSATVLFTLRSFMASHADAPTVAIAFGPGITIEAALLER